MGAPGRILHIQRYSLHDGPGLRTTVFLKGCPLDCAWCHNPESQDPEPVLVRNEARCVGCGACGEAVEAGDLAGAAGACPTEARALLGRDLTVDEVVEEVLRDRIFFDQSGGGATLSGGEPLLQAGFTADLLGALRARGVHTALDTCGLAPWQDLARAAAEADLVLFDLKHMDDGEHRKWTGAGNGPILANLEALTRAHRHVRIRIPLVPGVNDGDANIEATARFVASLPGIEGLDLLPYHGTGAAKFRRLGRTYLLDALRPPDPARVEDIAGHFRSRGIPAGVNP
ncbi:glycyl-radical enzyme activating protein [Mesoterricola sediminis]|uniref:Glycyl-radical enzyme activating protein n=1 Tax=Mesoterricola sediminis TaxID=2927980 RepID=A0AA48GR71_9BACT|nr:glycyl-radical enzyme activating protein [Mesoterricola sediminis]BDU76077.1 glycyl-radical enzyme activating protein [Mesoterricola sediminis]